MVRFDLDVFGEVDNEWEILNRIFIDATHRIVDETTAQQYRQGEDPRVVCGVLIECAKSLGVYHQYGAGLTIASLTFEGSSPDPESFGARVDGGSNAKPIGAVQDHAVQEVGLTCPVHAGHANYTDGSRQWLDKVEGLVVYDVFGLLGIELNERNSFIFMDALGVHVNFEFI